MNLKNGSRFPYLFVKDCRLVHTALWTAALCVILPEDELSVISEYVKNSAKDFKFRQSPLVSARAQARAQPQKLMYVWNCQLKQKGGAVKYLQLGMIAANAENNSYFIRTVIL